MRNKFFKEVPIYIGASVILLVILFLSIGFAVTIGSVDISIKEVYQVILYKLLNTRNYYVIFVTITLKCTKKIYEDFWDKDFFIDFLTLIKI